jgi:hypothetical protein
LVEWFLKAKDNIRKLFKQKIERRERIIDSGVPKEIIMQIERSENETGVKEFKRAIFPFLSTDILDRAERELVAYEQRQYYAEESWS